MADGHQPHEQPLRAHARRSRRSIESLPYARSAPNLRALDHSDHGEASLLPRQPGESGGGPSPMLLTPVGDGGALSLERPLSTPALSSGGFPSSGAAAFEQAESGGAWEASTTATRESSLDEDAISFPSHPVDVPRNVGQMPSDPRVSAASSTPKAPSFLSMHMAGVAGAATSPLTVRTTAAALAHGTPSSTLGTPRSLMSVPGEEEEDGEDQEDDDVFSTTTDTELEELLFAHGFIANPPAPLPDDIARAARLVDSMLANPERANYYIAQQQQQQQQQQRIGAAATLPPMPAASRTASLPDPMSIGSMGNSSSGGGGAGSGLAVGGGGGGVGPFAVDAKPVSSTVMPSYLGVSSAAALQTTATVQRFSSAPQCLPGVQQQGGWGGNVGGAGVGASYGQMGGPMFLRAHDMRGASNEHVPLEIYRERVMRAGAATASYSGGMGPGYGNGNAGHYSLTLPGVQSRQAYFDKYSQQQDSGQDFMFAALGARPILSAAGVPGAPALASAAHLHSHQGGPYPRRHSLPGGLAAPSQLSELAAFPEDTEMVRTHRLEDMLFSGVASGGARPPRPHLPQHQLQHPGHAQQQFLRAMGAEPGAGAGGATLQYPGAARGGGGGGGSAGAHRASAPVGQMHMQPFTAAAGDETVAQRQLFENVFSALF